MKISKPILIVFFLSSIFLLYSCKSDRPYVPPVKVESNPITKVSTPTQAEAQNASLNIKPLSQEIELPQTEEKKPVKTTFNIGETATDGELNITLNNVKFVSEINEKNNQFMTAKAQPNKEYAVLDITIENTLPDKTQNVSSMLSMELNDQDGYNYSTDFKASTALDKSFKEGEILPGMKRRGEIAFEVPKDVKELNFIYKFDAFAGTSAIFKVK